jgi:hypothetical protein
MTLLRQTTEETRREYHSLRQSRLIALGVLSPGTPPDLLRITRRRTWWLGSVPVWRWTVSVLEMPILMPRAKAPLVKP